MNVHVLVTVRNKELRRASEFVFDSIKVGFPRCDVVVTDNKHGLQTHADWIRGLIVKNTKPFWICDTDVAFFDAIDKHEFGTALAGMYVPRFMCPYTHVRTYERPHTAVMWIDPKGIFDSLAKWNESVVRTPFDTLRLRLEDLVRPCLQFHDGMRYLHDTCSKLACVTTTTYFNDEQRDAFSHCNAGTYSDLVDPSGGFTERNRSFFGSPRRCLWREQYEWYARNGW